MYVIEKTFRFEAAHHLNDLPEGHKCARVHGHSYAATFVLSARELDATGFVTDFTNLAPIGDYIATTLDHHNLNELNADDDASGVVRQVLPQPSSEHLACHLYRVAVRILPDDLACLVTEVRVSETRSSCAIYRPEMSRS